MVVRGLSGGRLLGCGFFGRFAFGFSAGGGTRFGLSGFAGFSAGGLFGFGLFGGFGFLDFFGNIRQRGFGRGFAVFQYGGRRNSNFFYRRIERFLHAFFRHIRFLLVVFLVRLHLRGQPGGVFPGYFHGLYVKDVPGRGARQIFFR